MTYMPNPSGTTANQEVGVSSVSSYQIQAMTLGSAKEYYNQRSSRFWFSGLPSSSIHHQLLPPTDNSLFEMRDCFSGIGFNQWKYTNAEDANLLKSPTLDNLSDWTVEYLHDDSEGMISRFTETLAGGKIEATHFELVKGQQQVTLRQQVPELQLGKMYTMYTEGKAHNATMDMRIGRGKNGIVLEYYDFSSGQFTEPNTSNSNLRHNLSLPSYYKTDSLSLRGALIDLLLLSKNNIIIGTYFSSFTEVSWWLGGAKAKVIFPGWE